MHFVATHTKGPGAHGEGCSSLLKKKSCVRGVKHTWNNARSFFTTSINKNWVSSKFDNSQRKRKIICNSTYSGLKITVEVCGKDLISQEFKLQITDKKVVTNFNSRKESQNTVVIMKYWSRRVIDRSGDTRIADLFMEVRVKENNRLPWSKNLLKLIFFLSIWRTIACLLWLTGSVAHLDTAVWWMYHRRQRCAQRHHSVRPSISIRLPADCPSSYNLTDATPHMCQYEWK